MTDNYENTEIILTAQQAQMAIENWLNEAYLREPITVIRLSQINDTEQLRVEVAD